MKTFLMLIILTAAVSISGCTTTSSVMRSWVGHDESKLLTSWGAPDTKMELDDGVKIYTWKRVWSNNYGIHHGRQTFTINADGKVTNWSYENMPRW